MKLPCVYAWVRGEEWLYVGFSSRGLSRPLTYGHHALDDFRDTDELLVWRFKTIRYAFTFEQKLIEEKRPTKNKAGIAVQKPVKPPEKPAIEPPARKPYLAPDISKRQSELCDRCGRSFQQARKWQRFCSKECRWDEWNEDHPRHQQIVAEVPKDEGFSARSVPEGKPWPNVMTGPARTR
jgi:hypothetical protein